MVLCSYLDLKGEPSMSTVNFTLFIEGDDEKVAAVVKFLDEYKTQGEGCEESLDGFLGYIMKCVGLGSTEFASKIDG
jgi:hypothetical protein